MTQKTVLAIDTSTHRGGVAIARVLADGAGISVLSARDYQGTTDHAERLLFEIEAALAEAGVGLPEIGLLAVCVGPGSFTGVRVGVSTAKALSLATGAPVFAMTSLELMAAGLGSVGAEGEQAEASSPTVALLDAKRGELFVGAYDASGKAVSPPTHLKATDIVGWLSAFRAPAVVGEVASSLPGLEGLRVVRGPLTDLPSASVLARLALGSSAAGQAVSGSLIEPSYLRPPDAVLPSGG